MNKWHAQVATRSFTLRNGFLGRYAWLFVAGLFIALTASGQAALLPSTDTFDDYTPGTTINGSNGWVVTGNGSVTATNDAAQLVADDRKTVTLAKTYSDTGQDVTITFDLQPVYTDTDPADKAPADATFLFSINTNGMISAYDGDALSNLTHAAISDSVATNFQVDLDYATSNWSLTVGGNLVVPDFGFYSSSNSTFSQLAFL